MPDPSPIRFKTCPSCDAPLLPGRALCPKCGMPLSQMANFQAAKEKALSEGLKTTVTHAPGHLFRTYLRPAVKVSLLLILLVGIWLIYHSLTRPKIAPWTLYPTDPHELLLNFIQLIDRDDDASHDKAYALITQRNHHPDDPNEIGFYHQTFHDIHKYMSGEFGLDWTNIMVISPDDLNPGNLEGSYKVQVGPETLHIEIEAQKPLPPSKEPDPIPVHYGVVEVREFPVDEAAHSQQMGGILGVVGAEGGPAAVRNLETVIGTAGAHPHETPMQTKRRLLPLARNPNVVRRGLLQLWPVRTDPVVRARLTAITTDARYDPDCQRTAQQILDERVDPEDLVAAGVDINN